MGSTRIALKDLRALGIGQFAPSTPRRKPVQHERDFHITAGRFLDVALPPDCWWSTFPAGGGGKARGGQLKAMGLKPGVPDILILHPTLSGTDVLWIELKAKRGSQAPEQKAFAARMDQLPGVDVVVCRTLRDIEEALRNTGIEARARVTDAGAWVVAEAIA